jgi:prevent-host-death family protein
VATQLTATAAKARFLSLLERVSAGEEIEITKHGRPVAKLVPAVGSNALRGALAGIALTADDEDNLLTTGETWDAA